VVFPDAAVGRSLTEDAWGDRGRREVVDADAAEGEAREAEAEEDILEVFECAVVVLTSPPAPPPGR
jgi:hypothetical protein